MNFVLHYFPQYNAGHCIVSCIATHDCVHVFNIEFLLQGNGTHNYKGNKGVIIIMIGTITILRS